MSTSKQRRKVAPKTTAKTRQTPEYQAGYRDCNANAAALYQEGVSNAHRVSYQRGIDHALGWAKQMFEETAVGLDDNLVFLAKLDPDKADWIVAHAAQEFYRRLDSCTETELLSVQPPEFMRYWRWLKDVFAAARQFPSSVSRKLALRLARDFANGEDRRREKQA